MQQSMQYPVQTNNANNIFYKHNVDSVDMIDHHFGFTEAANQRVTHSAEAEINLLGRVVSFAIEDSMPGEGDLFGPRSNIPLFKSFVPDVYDAYNFLMTDRIEPWLVIGGINASTVRKLWLARWESWKAEQGNQVLMNILDHVVYLLMVVKPGTVVHKDAEVFMRSRSINFWADIGGITPEEARNYVQSQIQTISGQSIQAI